MCKHGRAALQAGEKKSFTFLSGKQRTLVVLTALAEVAFAVWAVKHLPDGLVPHFDLPFLPHSTPTRAAATAAAPFNFTLLALQLSAVAAGLVVLRIQLPKVARRAAAAARYAAPRALLASATLATAYALLADK